MRKCSICQKELPKDAFVKSKSNKDGITSRCKLCHADRQRVYRTTHLEEIKETRQRDYSKNREVRINNSLQYYKENIEKVKLYKANWYEKNSEKISTKGKAKYSDPEYKFKYYSKNALIRELEFTLTIEEFTDLVSSPCFYCGRKASGIDRVINQIGYILTNSVSCCEQCNRAKLTSTKDDFLEMCRLVCLKHKLLE